MGWKRINWLWSIKIIRLKDHGEFKSIRVADKFRKKEWVKK